MSLDLFHSSMLNETQGQHAFLFIPKATMSINALPSLLRKGPWWSPGAMPW